MRNAIINRIFNTVLSVIIGAVLIIGTAVSVTADGIKDSERMAYNIYSNPNLSRTSGGFDTFMIDFRGLKTPKATYWSLANFNMDIEGSKMMYPGISRSHVYAGLQNTANGRKAIMSFWEYSYDNGKIMRANRVYPKGAESNFGGEGEGTNWITDYEWRDNTWYRMVIHSWTDKQTGTTFVGQWVLDIANNKWQLISYFDTHLRNSFMGGAMSQFQENYSHTNSEPEREFNFKNLYVLDHKDHKWKSLSRSKLSWNDPFNNKKGIHEIGATEEFFWGRAAGVLPDGITQDKYNSMVKDKVSFSIKQPDMPIFDNTPDTGNLRNVQVTRVKGGWEITWEFAPQLAYKVELLDSYGNVVASQEATRPEVRSVFLKAYSAIKCHITVTDIFGRSETIARFNYR